MGEHDPPIVGLIFNRSQKKKKKKKPKKPPQKAIELVSCTLAQIAPHRRREPGFLARGP
jgi:hypothetical protein